MSIVVEIKVDPEFLEETKRWGKFLTAYMENSKEIYRDTKREGKETNKSSKEATEEDKATESSSKIDNRENVENIGCITDAESEEREAETQVFPPVTETETVLEDETYTLEAVRAKLTELSRVGKREAVNTLITSYGVKRLTDLPSEHYTDIMQKAGEL